MNIAAGHRGSTALWRGGGAFGAIIAAALLATTALAQPLPAATGGDGATSTTVELGRLFFSPEQRRQLDRQRDVKPEQKPLAASAPTLTIDGVVTRSSGKRTIWIDGTAHNDGQQPDGVAIGTSRYTPGQIVVRPEGATAIPARVGDTVDRTTGEAGGALGKGSLTTRPAPSLPR